MSNPPGGIPNPYVGPRSFQVGERIYGRKREANQLLNLIVAERIVLLHSPSGAGKTSLIQAALIPRLKKMRFLVLPVVRVNLDVADTLAKGFECNRYVFSVLLSLEEDVPEEEKISPEWLSKMRLRAVAGYISSLRRAAMRVFRLNDAADCEPSVMTRKC